MIKEKIKLGIFDDHPIITEGIKNLFLDNNEIELVMSANFKDELFTKLNSAEIDILILDIITDDVNGLELFKEIPLKFPGISIIAYTTLNSAILVENILLTGARGYINKRQHASELIEAIKLVYSGQHYVPEQFNFLLKSKKTHDNPIELSNREFEVLSLILNGKLTKEIATILQISKNTVENHRTNLFKKFRVSNLAELIRQANRLGYTED